MTRALFAASVVVVAGSLAAMTSAYASGGEPVQGVAGSAVVVTEATGTGNSAGVNIALAIGQSGTDSNEAACSTQGSPSSDITVTPANCPAKQACTPRGSR